MSSEPRIEELESRVAFQEDAINKLSDVVFEQTQALTKLEARFGVLKQQLTQMHQQMGDDGPEHQPPPHY